MDQEYLNHLGQPVGRPLPEWVPARRPVREDISGRYSQLCPLDPDRHAEELYQVFQLDTLGRNWTYLPYGPFENFDDYRQWLSGMSFKEDPFSYAILDRATKKALGTVALQAIDLNNGSIEIGHVNFAPVLQRTRLATEAIYLLISLAFRSGYRRCEWKCASLNEASGRAARRFGFQYEGRFRQARVSKGRNRDTDWYSIIDGEWPSLNEVFQEWLDPKNFDVEGREKVSLSKMMQALKRC